MAVRNLVQNCRKVVCIGRNYADHIKELNSARPTRPFYFLKPPTALLPPHSGPVLRPRGTKLHYEVELALIIKHGLTNLASSDEKGALDAVESYALAIDLTARDIQDDAKRKGLPWTISKGFDTFCPISHPIPKHKIPDPHNVDLWLDVNGQRRQSDSTNLMLFDIPRILSEISGVMRLESGDVVLTGTPKGVGEVRAGERMTAGLSVQGREIEEGGIDVRVEEREGGYVV